MKKTKIIFLLVALLTVGCRQIPEEKLPIRECATPPEGRAGAICFALGDTAYVVGGR